MAVENLPIPRGGEPLPPHNTDAEEALLGSLLIDRDAITPVAALLRAEDFYRERNAVVYAAMLALNERREPVDADGKARLDLPAHQAPVELFVPVEEGVEDRMDPVQRPRLHAGS